MMLVRSKRTAFMGTLIALLLMAGIIIYTRGLAVYTASLDSRCFNAGLAGEVSAVEPAQAVSDAERLISAAIYEGLVTFDQKSGEIKPMLAKKWQYSADGKSLTITLKKNLKFSNGREVKAQNVKSAWEHNVSTAADWYNVNLFLNIVGAKERIEGKNPDISGLQVVDRYTLKINFLKPNMVFVSVLANPMFWVADVSDPEALAGTGPFILKKKQEDSLLLLRNEKYHRGLPRLSAINMTIYADADLAFKDYQTGKLDYLNAVPLREISSIKKNPAYKGLFLNQPLLETYILGFNQGREPYARNYLLRRALNYAIDRNALNDSVFGGAYIPLKGVVPAGAPGYNPHTRGYSGDSEKAKQLLEEAGYPGGEGLRLLTLSYNSDPGHKEVADALALQLANLGINVQTLPVEWSYYKKELASMGMSFFRVGWRADYPDAESFLYSLQHSSQMGISNFSGYYNPQVDKLLDNARGQKKQEERFKLLNRAEQIIIDDAPYLWLFQKQTTSLISKQVNNLQINGLGIIDWYKVELKKPSLEEPKGPSGSREV